MTRSALISKLCLGLTTAAMLAACSSGLESVETRKVYLGDGTRAYRLSCGQPRQSANDCYEQAGHLCDDKGYIITQQTGAEAPSETNVSAPMLSHDIFVKCKS